jgi:hypothetical protein
MEINLKPFGKKTLIEHQTLSLGGLKKKNKNH